jgi:hypothetical protein
MVASWIRMTLPEAEVWIYSDNGEVTVLSDDATTIKKK